FSSPSGPSAKSETLPCGWCHECWVWAYWLERGGRPEGGKSEGSEPSGLPPPGAPGGPEPSGPILSESHVLKPIFRRSRLSTATPPNPAPQLPPARPGQPVTGPALSPPLPRTSASPPEHTE